MGDKEFWLACSNADLVDGWREAWWIEARPRVRTNREQRRLIDESDAVRLAVLDLVAHDPARALEVGFLIARTADHPGMLLNVGVGILQELLKADETLWAAIALEAAANPTLLKAIAHVWEVNVPNALWDEVVRAVAEPPSAPEAGPSLDRRPDL